MFSNKLKNYPTYSIRKSHRCGELYLWNFLLCIFGILEFLTFYFWNFLIFEPPNLDQNPVTGQVQGLPLSASMGVEDIRKKTHRGSPGAHLVSQMEKICK
jgi:hypothetical protein